MGSAKEQIAIRDIDRIADVQAVEELQKEIWGIPDIEVVPLTQLIAARASGGVLVGAFDGESPVGFAYGFVGFERGVTVHHSHMLAVRPEYRSHDIGLRLKVEQRARVLEQGIKVMTWTFDPLQSLNAYFNINKLGAVSDRYLVNFYGESAASFLHRTGTDRFWVSWLLDSRRVSERLQKDAKLEDEPPGLPRVIELDERNRPILTELKGISSETISVEIPADINALEKHDSVLAAEWREVTRRMFTEAVGAGFIVKEFYRGIRNGQQFGSYVLTRDQIEFK